MIDLRSDTVTKPTNEMRKAMYDAELGDDVYGEDPTVNKLQDLAAEITGKEAALLVSSGTMGNLVSLLTLTNRGEEIILGDQCHVYAWEGAGVPIFGGVSLNVIKNKNDGTLDLNDIKNAINPTDDHKPSTSVVSIENTQNQCSGSPISEEYLMALQDLCNVNKLKSHMDGARLFNASVYLNIEASALTKHVDSVTFCLSKGLSCPIGSIICGSQDFILRAKRWRKSIGGGMRQAGVFAAAGIIGLNKMTKRLGEDHQNAYRLAHGLADIDGIDINPEVVKTNIVRFSISNNNPRKFYETLKSNGVLVNPSNSSLRMVTHYGITSDDIDLTLAAVSKTLREI